MSNFANFSHDVVRDFWFLLFLSLCTEQMGQEILENLSHDREKIQRARERVSLISKKLFLCISMYNNNYEISAVL